MTNKDIQDYLKAAVIKRWLRTFFPQVPALLVYLSQEAAKTNLPSWGVPLLVLLGACATALDKFLREIDFYEEIKQALLNK